MDSPQTSGAAGKSRRKMLEDYLATHPSESFARYGLAVECVNEGDAAAAEEHFRRLLREHPDYVAAYYQFGRMLAANGRTSEAQDIFAEGVRRAAAAGDAHARSELEAALAELCSS